MIPIGFATGVFFGRPGGVIRGRCSISADARLAGILVTQCMIALAAGKQGLRSLAALPLAYRWSFSWISSSSGFRPCVCGVSNG